LSEKQIPQALLKTLKAEIKGWSLLSGADCLQSRCSHSELTLGIDNPKTGHTEFKKNAFQAFGRDPKALPVSCRCHMNGEKNYKKRIKEEKRRKI
jgi:hypothetical protein